MASRGSIPKVMEMAGIEMLSPEAGIPVIRRELIAGGTQGEVVIGQGLGVLMKEWDDTGGLAISAGEIFSENPSRNLGPVCGKISTAGIFSPLIVETTLDPKLQPFLHDHQIEGTPVLPGVMGIEAFAEAALCLLPGWNIEAIENVDFLAPFKFYRNEQRTLTVETMIHPQGETVVADCQLIGHRPLSNQKDPQTTVHFTGRVRLTKQISHNPPSAALGPLAGSLVEADAIYRLYFHGPAYQVVERAWWDGKRVVALMSQQLPNNHYPAGLPTIAAPRLIELCFQAAGIWEMGVQSRMGLPRHVASVAMLGMPELAKGRLYAVVTPNPDLGSFDAEVVDLAGNRYLRLDDYRTVSLPEAVDPERRKAFQALLSAKAVAVA